MNTTTLPQPTQVNPQPEISVVVPVYNEQDNLEPLCAELIPTLERLGKPFELIFVDDGSTDRSYAVLGELHTADNRLRVIQFRRNFGQTAAFAAGFDYAQGAVIVTLDADGQNDPADIPRVLNLLEEGDYDVVSGWRTNRKESPVRRLVSRVANQLISRSTHITIHDRGCSLKAFRTDLAKNMRLYGQLHRFLPELAAAVGARVAEIPVNDRARKFGRSKYGALSRTPRVILDLITVFYLLSFFSSPMRFFGGIGIGSASLGSLIGGGLALAKIFHGITGGWAGFNAYEIGSRPLFLGAILLILVGIQFLMMGLLGEMMMRIYYESQDKRTYVIRRVLD